MQLALGLEDVAERAVAPPRPHWTPERLLRRLRNRGARRLKGIAFRNNRSTIWSLTQRGTVLNLHVAYESAPPAIVDRFGDIARYWSRGGAEYRAAARAVREWSELHDAIERVRQTRPARRRRKSSTTPCSGAPEQRVFLRTLYQHLNRTRLDGLLPDDLPLRFSGRMKQRLGHVAREERLDRRGNPAVPSAAEVRNRAELALNVDLLLPGNEEALVDTLLHEMAHVADYMTRGTTDHGPEWVRWARRVGCDPSVQATTPIRRRRRGQRVDHVPSLPRNARSLLLRG